MPESCAHCMMNRKWSTKRLPSKSATPAQVAHLEIQTELPTCAQGGGDGVNEVGACDGVGGSWLTQHACLEPACLLRFNAATSAYRVVAQSCAARSGACRVRPACSTRTSQARAMARRRASARLKEAHDAGKLCGAHAGKAGERASGP